MAQAGKSSSGGNLKYILGGLVLLAGAVVVWISLQDPPPPAPPPAPPKVENSQRVNPLAAPDFILAEEEPPDAGKPAAEEPAAQPADKSAKRPAREPRDAWDCSGDLARAALQKVVEGHRAQIRSCYERRLKVNNILQGDLALKIKVGASGQTTAVNVTGSLRDNEVFNCVRGIAQKWTFPPPVGGDCAVVQIPFQFSPRH